MLHPGVLLIGAQVWGLKFGQDSVQMLEVSFCDVSALLGASLEAKLAMSAHRVKLDSSQSCTCSNRAQRLIQRSKLTANLAMPETRTPGAVTEPRSRTE